MTRTVRGRPPKITPEIENVIYATLQKNLKETIEKIHDEIEIYLIEKVVEEVLKDDNIPRENLRESELDYVFETVYGEAWKNEGQLFPNESSENINLLPDESTIDKYVRKQKIREKIKRLQTNLEGLDSQWSIGACLEYKIPYEMIPLLTKYTKIYFERRNLNPFDLDQAYYDERGNFRVPNYFDPRNSRWVRWNPDPSGFLLKLTIRKAQWMSRLYQVVSKLVKEHLSDKDFDEWVLFLLSDIADVYVANEIRNEVLERNVFDSFEIDKMIFGRDFSCYKSLISAVEEAWIKISPEYAKFPGLWKGLLEVLHEQQNASNDKELK